MKKRSDESRGTKDNSDETDAGVAPGGGGLVQYDDQDASQLERTRLMWKTGDWDSLLTVDPQKYRDHTDRHLFALFRAAAHFQLGDTLSAEKFVRLARNWGADNRLVARLLISGAHNTMGRLFLLAGDQKKPVEHFRAALEVEKNDQREVLKDVRTMREMGRLGMISQAKALLEADYNKQDINGRFDSSRRLRHDYKALKEYVLYSESERERIGAATGHGNEKHLDLKSGANVDIVIAGMRHSGSTALFNILRLALEQSAIAFESGYSEREWVLGPRTRPVRLIKTHELRDDLLPTETLIITSVRDLRDAVASGVRRKFDMCEKLGGAVAYAKYNRSLDELWADRSDYVFRYEEFMRDPYHAIRQLLDFVGLEDVDISRVQEQVLHLPTDNYNTTLLSNTHITDPERTLNYTDTLTENEIRQITSQNLTWLLKYDYL
ncbi:MAG: sulfotransferase domain-containing protein [Pseudomonadota bacterium]